MLEFVLVKVALSGIEARVRLAHASKLWLLLLSCQCGARSGLPGEGPSVDSKPPAPIGDGVPVPARCVDEWQTLAEFQSTKPSAALARAAGEVFFAWSNEEGAAVELRAVGEASKHERVLASVADCDELWAEGDGILCWANNKLLRIPKAGGEPELVLDGQTPATPEINGSVLVAPGDLYWTQRIDSATIGVWRQGRRPGNAKVPVALLNGAEVIPYELAVEGDTLVAAGLGAAVLPLNGQSPRLLAALEEADFVGVDMRGAYYRQRIDPGIRGGVGYQYEIFRAPIDGSPIASFWRGQPGRIISYLWEMGSDWLATGEYYLEDGKPHPVVLKLDAGGAEAVLACGPERSRVSGRPLVADGALYFVTANPGELYRVIKAVLAAPDGSR
jgi:hypothetical protein